MPTRIAMVIAHQGFRDEEYWVPKEQFEGAGFEVTTISSSITPAVSKFGKQAGVDLDINHLSVNDYDALVFVGGPGTDEYFQDKTAHRLARETLEQNKLLTAICIAPVILANAGLLQNKRATVFPSGEPDLTQGGATYTGEQVTQDGQVITANGPDAAVGFAREIISHFNI